MVNSLFIALVLVLSQFAMAQSDSAILLRDARSGCGVWFKHYFSEDSVTWTGDCRDGLAEGSGTMSGFTLGKQTSGYTGSMRAGWPDGQGVFFFVDGRKLEGNFSAGEPFFLSEECRAHTRKHVISEQDSTDAYLGDNGAKALYYHALVPDGRPVGALVLMPGTWETTEHLFSSTRGLCESAYARRIAVLALSINQRLTLNDAMRGLMNRMLDDAIRRYGIPENAVVIGGWSMGGLFSLRYTEHAFEDATSTRVRPAGAFSCDGPCDLESLYAFFQRRHARVAEASEPVYGMRELERYCGGGPDAARAQYIRYSCYSHAQPGGGNARYLAKVPVRIYCDVDPVWWMHERGENLYDMNALDQSAMILQLNDLGNDRAEFINACGRGYRIEGNRHPHSWSIVEPKDCLAWILSCIGGRAAR
jgi:pimeloyl-ACP methyl ester carboxylesterase